MEVVPGVHSLPATAQHGVFSERMPPNVYLVMGQRKAVIDTGYEDEEPLKYRLEYLDGLGISRLDYIIVTHFHRDHLGGAAKIKERKGGALVMHPLDTEEAEKALGSYKVERKVQDGEVLDLGGVHLQFIHTPGHTPGEICIYHQEGKILFTGDHVLGAGTTAVNPQHGDMGHYIESLRKLLKIETSLLCPGHGPVVKDAAKKIQEQIQHRLDREEQVLSLVRQGKRTVDEMLPEIYAELDPGLFNNAKGQIRTHLIKLERDGKVRTLDSGETYALT